MSHIWRRAINCLKIDNSSKLYMISKVYGMELNNMTVGPKTPCFWFLIPDIFRIHLLSDHQNSKCLVKILESCATPNWSNRSVGQKESRSQVPDPESQILNPKS